MKTYYARAKRKAGEMTETERKYGDHLEFMKRAGQIIEYWYEPFNIHLAEGVYYKADFLVHAADGVLEVHEVKGAAAVIEEKAVIKAKLVAEKFPFRMRIVWPKPKREGGWNYRDFDRGRIKD
jgi:hypothetical protein